MATLRAAVIIALRIVRQRIRDRSALIFTILTPLGLAVAFSALIPSDFSSYHTTFVVVDQDSGATAAAFMNGPVAALARAGVADTSTVPTEAQATAMVRDGSVGAAIVLPAGLSAAVASGQPAEIRILGGRYATAVELARALVTGFASDVGAVQLMVAGTAEAGQPVDQATVQRAIAAVQQPAPVVIAADPTTQRQAGLATFYGAAMAIMFVFFATQYGALAIHAERQNGTLARLLAAPIPPSAIVLGTSLAAFLLGLLSMSVLVLATTLLNKASWGPPLLVALLVVAAALAATGISTLVATVARNQRQAGGLNSIVAMCLATIGGVFLPLSQMPASIQSLSQITPHAWFLRGIDTLSDPTSGLADILPSLVVLVAMGAMLGGIGLARARRSLVTT